jgi:transcriptional regulator with XRE-family HTH domain
MTKNTLSNRITKARIAKKWTKKELADVLKVNVKNVARWESGESKPLVDAAADIAIALNISLDELAGLKADAQSNPLLALLSKKIPTLKPNQKKALETIIRAF